MLGLQLLANQWVFRMKPLTVCHFYERRVQQQPRYGTTAGPRLVASGALLRPSPSAWRLPPCASPPSAQALSRSDLMVVECACRQVAQKVGAISQRGRGTRKPGAVPIFSRSPKVGTNLSQLSANFLTHFFWCEKKPPRNRQEKAGWEPRSRSPKRLGSGPCTVLFWRGFPY